MVKRCRAGNTNRRRSRFFVFRPFSTPEHVAILVLFDGENEYQNNGMPTGESVLELLFYPLCDQRQFSKRI